ncbi:hypothetical protein CPC08DRAFT_709755, partial [Agrocybe pediades]
MEATASAPAPERYGLFPLTVFDRMFERTTFVTGWLVEGAIDAALLAAALDRVTEKWRLLAGRLVSVKEQNDVKWYVKTPLGPLPKDYASYALTTSTSDVPLSKYVPIPLPSVSSSPPPSVFIHSSTPRQYTAWEEADHPLTCWNLTYFPASANNGRDYTCIGFARCHGIFDGGGAAQIIDAVVAELNGGEWKVPPLPLEGMNLNPVEEILARAALAEKKDFEDVVAYTPMGPAGFLKLVGYHVKERWWKGADRRVIVMSKGVLDFLVEDVRSTLRREKKQAENVTTGDILVAWIFKTVYSNGTSPKTIVHCTNMASFRAMLEPQFEGALDFPHNAFVPLPYPLLSVGELQAFPLPALANLFMASRLSLSMHHVVSAYKMLQTSCFPNRPDADETLNISNVSASRILEADWKTLGAKRTICGYRYQATPTDVLFTNALYIAGRLDDGSVVLDVSLTKARFELLSGEVQRLTARLGRNNMYAAKT